MEESVKIKIASFIRKRLREIRLGLFAKPFILCLLMITHVANAGAWTNYSNIAFIQQRSMYPGYFVKLQDTHINPEGCINNYWYQLEGRDSYAKDVITLITTAHAAKQQISLYVNNCAGAFPRIERVVVK